MDFANRGAKRPAQQQQQSTQHNDAMNVAAPQFNNARNNGGMDTGKISSMFILVATSILVLALIFALIFAKDTRNKEAELIATDKYQAVFLDSQDGQVYFGKLAVFNDSTYVLKDIYYVRVENPIQPDGGQAQAANISLAKLGNELHAPEDYMFISKSQVLYWENLTDDGQVVKAIKDYVANGEQTTTAPASGTQPAGTPQQNDTPAETPTTPETTTP